LGGGGKIYNKKEDNYSPLEKEAIKVLQSSPKWKAGENGKTAKLKLPKIEKVFATFCSGLPSPVQVKSL
jgi:hypothetical protein